MFVTKIVWRQTEIFPTLVTASSVPCKPNEAALTAIDKVVKIKARISVLMTPSFNTITLIT